MRIDILRHTPGEPDRVQRFAYEPSEPGETVATALRRLNARPELRDMDGALADPIVWEHSCGQKKCGACAMVINGKPQLACDTPLSGCGDILRLEPLKKFPVVRDLLVDRTVMLENLKALGVWVSEPAPLPDSQWELAFDASRCLQCGLCLEVCPNFAPDGRFIGAAGAVPLSRVPQELRRLRKDYNKLFYKGCGKSLACKDICPAGLDTERMMTRSNGALLWKALLRRNPSKEG